MHKNAAGISFQEKFLDNLLEYSNTNISEEGLKSCYIVDYIFNYSEFIAPIIMSVSDNPSLWGNDIKEPTAVVEKIPLDIDSFTIMGPNRDCVKFTNRGVEFIKFKDKNFIEDLQKYRRFDITVYGKFNQNVWKGRKSPQFIIEDYEIINTEDDF